MDGGQVRRSIANSEQTSSHEESHEANLSQCGNLIQTVPMKIFWNTTLLQQPTAIFWGSRDTNRVKIWKWEWVTPMCWAIAQLTGVSARDAIAFKNDNYLISIANCQYFPDMLSQLGSSNGRWTLLLRPAAHHPNKYPVPCLEVPADSPPSNWHKKLLLT